MQSCRVRRGRRAAQELELQGICWAAKAAGELQDLEGICWAAEVAGELQDLELPESWSCRGAGGAAGAAGIFMLDKSVECPPS